MARIVTQNCVALNGGDIPAGTEILTSYVGLRRGEWFVVYADVRNVGRWGCVERQKKWGVFLRGSGGENGMWFKTCAAALARATRLNREDAQAR